VTELPARNDVLLQKACYTFVEFIDAPTLVTEQPRPLKESLDNQQNAEVQRERYYATIHKVALQAGGDKIPGNLGLSKVVVYI
jgi:hypothetical protein